MIRYLSFTLLLASAVFANSGCGPSSSMAPTGGSEPLNPTPLIGTQDMPEIVRQLNRLNSRDKQMERLVSAITVSVISTKNPSDRIAGMAASISYSCPETHEPCIFKMKDSL
jgi:hypothetical protein